eukprot:1641615-Ditylum_brightwellii.AAC.1
MTNLINIVEKATHRKMILNKIQQLKTNFKEEANRSEKDNVEESENEWSNLFQQREIELTHQNKDTESDDNSTTPNAIIIESQDEISSIKDAIDQCEVIVQTSHLPLSRLKKHTKQDDAIKEDNNIKKKKQQKMAGKSAMSTKAQKDTEENDDGIVKINNKHGIHERKNTSYLSLFVME